MPEPVADRPFLPPDYEVPTSTDGLLPWSWAEERLARATTYWIATTGADLGPHMVPIWGSWADGRWYVEGGPTRWKRNLLANPQMAVKVEFGKEVVILEGPVRELVAPPEVLAERILAGYAKYIESDGYTAAATNWTEGGLWELTPVKAFAWSVFPADMTRFRFG